MSILKAARVIFTAISYRIKAGRQREQDLEFRRTTLLNESYITASLRDQIEDILDEMDKNERTVDSAVIVVDEEVVQYMTEAIRDMDCTLIPCATRGVYILSRESDDYL